VCLRSVSIVQDTLAELGLSKFIQSNANSKTDVDQYLETLQRSFIKKNIRQMSSIKTDALMNSVHSTFHYTDMAVDS
jgi:phage host-nuclease inhibitor protein Gam